MSKLSRSGTLAHEAPRSLAANVRLLRASLRAGTALIRHTLLILLILAFEAAVIVVSHSSVASMLIPSVGVFLNLYFVLLKVSRTGAWTTWSLAKYSSTDREKLFQLYGLSIVFGSILLLWVFRAIAKTAA